MEYILNVAENYSLRMNLLYAGGLYGFFYSYYHSFLSGGGLFSFLGYIVFVAIIYALIVALVAASFGAFMFFYSQYYDNSTSPVNWSEYIDCKDEEINKEFANKKIPMETFLESYLAGRSEFKGDLHEIMRNHRHKLFKMAFTKGHIDFFYKKFLLQTFGHTPSGDHKDVTETYNLGNDFYNFFLGSSMVYTCAIFNKPEEETLEQAQRNKIDLVCNKVELKAGEKHLDIGCGWGTFVCHAAKNYGTQSTGITIAREQIDWGKKQIALLEPEVQKRAEVVLQDYRDIPADKKWNKITCLEMAEHVGVKNFQKFSRQLYGILEDDGLLYIQMCGLRPAWQFEDLIWGLFMAKYIFPGADSSCPCGWVCQQLEKAGFEIHSAETVTYHYGLTIKRWYDNWNKNKDEVIKRYGQRPWRLFNLFLGWSVLIAEQGTSGCYQIVAHKNQDKFDRGQFVGKVGAPGPYVGKSEPVTRIPPDALPKAKSN